MLGRDDIGSIEPGRAADFALFDLNRVAYAGASHDPLAALIFCAPQVAACVIVNGKVIVKESQITTADMPKVVERHNQISRMMIDGD